MTGQPPTIAVPLTQLGLLDVRGPDAAAFLQGQLSNDVRAVTLERAQLSSCNSPKGRMLAVLHVLRPGSADGGTRPEGDAFLLEVHRGVLEAVLKRLRMYVLRSKVTLAEAGGHALFGVAGPDAAAVLGALGLPAPEAPLACAWAGGVGVMRRLGAPPRYTVLAPAGGDLGSRLAARAAPGTTQDWQRLDIEAGVPTVYPQTQDRFVAQMCNLDTLGGISFDKGCYTGQEIIARVHYRGAVKRHMERRALAGPPPEPGTRLDTGEVVDAVSQGDGSLALIVTSAAEAPST
jgi:folate-binding protein YgfZ